MIKRDLWVVCLGMNIACAIVGALVHSPFLFGWNMVWIGIDLYVLGKLEA